jgi:hypothetical protein
MTGKRVMYTILYRVYTDRHVTVRTLRQRSPERDLYVFQGTGPWGEGVSLRDLPYGEAFAYCAIVDEYCMVLDAWTDRKGRWNIVGNHFCNECGGRVLATMRDLAEPSKNPRAANGAAGPAGSDPPATAFQAIDAHGLPMPSPRRRLPWVAIDEPSAAYREPPAQPLPDEARNDRSPWPEEELVADWRELLEGSGSPENRCETAGWHRWHPSDMAVSASCWLGRAAIFLWATLATPSRLALAASPPEDIGPDRQPPIQQRLVVALEFRADRETSATQGSPGSATNDRNPPGHDCLHGRAAPQRAAPQRAAPQREAPQREAPQSLASQLLAPQRVASGRVASGHFASGWGRFHAEARLLRAPALSLLRRLARPCGTPLRPRRQRRGH